MIGGDFNLVAHSGLDRVVSNADAFPKTLTHLLSSHQLVDSWHAHNMGARGYNFYSHPHDSYSRLDYIYSTPVMLANSNSENIHPCSWSDHHMVLLAISHIGISPTNGTWHLNDPLRSDPELVSKVSGRLDEYFRINNTQHTPPTILWAAHKAVIRRHLIELATAKKEHKLADITRLSGELTRLYHIHN